MRCVSAFHASKSVKELEHFISTSLNASSIFLSKWETDSKCMEFIINGAKTEEHFTCRSVRRLLVSLTLALVASSSMRNFSWLSLRQEMWFSAVSRLVSLSFTRSFKWDTWEKPKEMAKHMYNITKWRSYLLCSRFPYIQFMSWCNK